MKFEITTIQFFNQTFERPISETDTETVRQYSANIAINDKFIIQLSGNDNSCECSIPSSDEMCWNGDKDQDWARENVDEDELVAWLVSEGVENNFAWLEANAHEAY